MVEKNNKKIIWFGLALSLFFFLIFFFTKNIGQSTSSIPSPSLILPNVTEAANQAFLEITEDKLESAISEKKVSMIL